MAATHDEGQAYGSRIEGRAQLSRTGSEVEVHFFESVELPHHWTRLDVFEGAGYRRVVTQVQSVGGELDAWIDEIVARSG